jgi:hypothetical protein
MYLNDGKNIQQYGMFGSLFPSKSIQRMYSFEMLKSQKGVTLECGADFFSTSPGIDTLKCNIDDIIK